MSISTRAASALDAPAIASLIHELATSLDETSGVTVADVVAFLAHPGCEALLAEEAGAPIGVLTYSFGPDLFHAAPCGAIRELVVTASARGRGAGGLLMAAILAQGAALGWAELSVSTMADDRGAADFYRAHGFADDALQLAHHWASPR